MVSAVAGQGHALTRSLLQGSVGYDRGYGECFTSCGYMVTLQGCGVLSLVKTKFVSVTYASQIFLSGHQNITLG